VDCCRGGFSSTCRFVSLVPQQVGKKLGRSTKGWRPSVGRENMTRVGLVSRAYDKLPGWAKIFSGIFGIAALVYGLTTEGPIFLLKVLLKPVP
jgi:hypothetical protein